jgi:thiol-disulfide isomerase/thioredoxin
MRRQALGVIVALIVISLVSIYFYGVNKGLIVSGFTSGSGNSKLTMYYVDWCPHCKDAKPDFQSLGSSMKVNGNTVDISMINPETTPEAAAGKPVKGYPTILFEKPSGDIVEYSGERNKTGYLSFLQSNA